MSTTVQNPYQNFSSQAGTQPQQPAPPTPPAPAVSPTAGITPIAKTAAVTSAVDKPTETVQGQMDSILSQDSPLMQRARSLATQQANERGLINSSISAGAGTAAMIDAARPIAAQDAQTYGQRSMFNTDVMNQNAQFSAGQSNDLFKFGQDQASVSDRFNAEQFNLERRQLIDNQAQLERLGLQINANNQNIPAGFAANISNTAMSGVNAILADPNMTPAAKQASVNNLINYATAQISWAEKFYKMPIPSIGGATLT